MGGKVCRRATRPAPSCTNLATRFFVLSRLSCTRSAPLGTVLAEFFVFKPLTFLLSIINSFTLPKFTISPRPWGNSKLQPITAKTLYWNVSRVLRSFALELSGHTLTLRARRRALIQQRTPWFAQRAWFFTEPTSCARVSTPVLLRTCGGIYHKAY